VYTSAARWRFLSRRIIFVIIARVCFYFLIQVPVGFPRISVATVPSKSSPSVRRRQRRTTSRHRYATRFARTQYKYTVTVHCFIVLLLHRTREPFTTYLHRYRISYVLLLHCTRVYWCTGDGHVRDLTNPNHSGFVHYLNYPDCSIQFFCSIANTIPTMYISPRDAFWYFKIIFIW
jgi:hypothetical protein